MRLNLKQGRCSHRTKVTMSTFWLLKDETIIRFGLRRFAGASSVSGQAKPGSVGEAVDNFDLKQLWT